jgi:hypothetical protein
VHKSARYYGNNVAAGRSSLNLLLHQFPHGSGSPECKCAACKRKISIADCVSARSLLRARSLSFSRSGRNPDRKHCQGVHYSDKVITKFDKAMMHYSLERHGAFYPSVKGDQKVIGGGATRIVRPHLIISRTD